MTAQPKISVIIPVYNAENYLRKCLQSVCEQSLKDLEIICINDGSTDNSQEILERFAADDSRIRIIKQSNAGLSATRNKGILLAKGEYLGFVDADDWINPDFYNTLYTAADNKNADVALGGIICVKDDSRKPLIWHKKSQSAVKSAEKFKLCKLPAYNYVVNKIYRRDFILRNKFLFTEGVYYEDMLWSSLVIFAANAVVSVPDATYYYQNTPNSITNTTKNDLKKRLDLKKATENINEFIVLNRIPVSLRDEYKIKMYFLGIPFLKIYSNQFQKRYYFFRIKILHIKKNPLF